MNGSDPSGLDGTPALPPGHLPLDCGGYPGGCWPATTTYSNGTIVITALPPTPPPTDFTGWGDLENALSQMDVHLVQRLLPLGEGLGEGFQKAGAWLKRQNTCTGLIGQGMSDLYHAGDITAKAGGGMVVFAGVLQAGDVTPAAPATITGGLTIGAAGLVGVAVGTTAKAVASAWYLSKGNPFPAINTGTSGGFGLLGDSPQNAVLESGLEAEEESIEGGAQEQCHP